MGTLEYLYNKPDNPKSDNGDLGVHFGYLTAPEGDNGCVGVLGDELEGGVLE